LSDAPDGLSIAGIVGGVVTILTAIGTGINRMLTRKDRREAAQDARDDAVVVKLEGRVAALEQDNRRIWLALSYVVPALYAHDPHSPALKAASLILGDAMPIPPDMAEALKKIP
jgi:hypothetical protein